MHRGWCTLADALLVVHVEVTCYGQPIFWGARISVPTNLNLQQWAKRCVTPQNHVTFPFLQFGFATGYEGPGPTPTFENNSSAVHHTTDVAAYILKELKEEAMLGPFDQPPFTPWTQTTPLLTRLKKDSHLRCVIMDLFWTLSPGGQCKWWHSKRDLFGHPQKDASPIRQ